MNSKRRLALSLVFFVAITRSAVAAFTWTEYSTGKNDFYFQSVIFDGNRFLTVGNSSWNASVIFSSRNGLQWEQEASILNASLKGIAFGNGRYVAIDFFGKAYWSENAKDWSEAPWQQIYTCQHTLYKIVFGKGKFIAVGQGSDCKGNINGLIFSSTNGVQWTLLVRPSRIFDVIYGGNLFLAGGEGRDSILLSNDGESWSARQPSIPDTIMKVGYGSERLIAFGEKYVQTSFNGLNWNLAQTGAFTPSGIFSVTYGAGWFLAAGREGKAFLSTDGESWEKTNLGTSKNVNSGCFANGVFVLVGQSGTIWSSSATMPLPGLKLDINSGVQIAFDSEPGIRYQIQSSLDLTNWANEGDPILASANRAARFFALRDSKQRYFRAVRVLN